MLLEVKATAEEANNEDHSTIHLAPEPRPGQEASLVPTPTIFDLCKLLHLVVVAFDAISHQQSEV